MLRHVIGCWTCGRKILMDRRHDRCAFADRASDALDRPRAHVADGEHAGNAAFERGRRAFACTLRECLTGEHESVRVQSDAAIPEPAGLRIRTDEEEYVAYRSHFLAARPVVTPRHRGEAR